MKDSSKLFLSSIGIVVCGFIKGMVPTALGESFDGSSFLCLGAIAIIVAVLGLIKYLRGK